MKVNIKTLSLAGILSGLVFLLAMTPAGIIPLGFINLTIVHIPVIIGTVVAGLKTGLVMGTAFGLASTLAAFGMSLTSQSGLAATLLGYSPIAVILMSMVPRIMIPVVTNFIYTTISKRSWTAITSSNAPKWVKNRQTIAVICAALAGSLTNTVLYLGLMGIFFAIFGIWGTFAAIITITLAIAALCEALAAALVAVPVTSAVQKSRNKTKTAFPEETTLLNKKLSPDKDIIEVVDEDIECVGEDLIAVIPSADAICPAMDDAAQRIHDKALKYMQQNAYMLSEQLFDSLICSSQDWQWRLDMEIYIVDLFIETGAYVHAAHRLGKIFTNEELWPFLNSDNSNTISGILTIINRAVSEQSDLQQYKVQQLNLAYNKLQTYINNGAWNLVSLIFKSYLATLPVA